MIDVDELVLVLAARLGTLANSEVRMVVKTVLGILADRKPSEVLELIEAHRR